MKQSNSNSNALEVTSCPNSCPLCGEESVDTIMHHDSFRYGAGESAVTLHVDLPVRYCSTCDEHYLDGEGQMLKHEAVCRHLGYLTPAEVRSVRRLHGMSRAAFARVTGFGEATLNRWEHGAVIQHRCNDRFLRLLESPWVMSRLKSLMEEGSESSMPAGT